MKRLALCIGTAFTVLFSCTPPQNSDAPLATQQDSISFAVGLYLAEDMRRIAFEQFGVDTTCVDEFVQGIRDAFPENNDKKKLAYSNGLQIGARAVDMMRQAQHLLYGNDSTRKIVREQFIEGVVASVYGGGKGLAAKDAVEYFNSYKYRGESEKFMRENATREGVVALPGGLQYKMAVQGKGEIATVFDTVRCIYKGTFPNGRSFDTSRGLSMDIPVGAVIPGLSEALCLLPEGSKCKIYIPWHLGYGAAGNSVVPPYSSLVFDIEIIKVIRNKTKH